MERREKTGPGVSRRQVLAWSATAGAMVLSQAPPVIRRATAADATLRHLVAINPAMAPAFKEVIAAFEKEQPGARVSFDLVGWDEAVTKASQAAAGGRPYDVIDAGASENQWTVQQHGLLEPITDVVDTLGGETFIAPVYLTKWKGEHWMIPYLAIVLHIEYRKDLFDAKNIEAPFRTWDEWLEAARLLTDRSANRYGFIMPLKTSYFLSTLHASMLLSNGGHVIDAKGNVAFDSPQAVEMLEFSKRLAEYCVPNQGEQGIDDLQTLFYNELSAMTWYSEVDIVLNTQQLNPGLEGKIGIMPIPARTEAQTPALRMISQYLSIGKGSRNRELAKAYIRYLFKVDNLVKILESVPIANVPTVPAVTRSPALWSDPQISKHRQLYLDYIDIAEKYGRELAIQENPGVVNPKTGQILGENLLSLCVQDVILKGAPPKTAAATWAKKMDEVVKG